MTLTNTASGGQEQKSNQKRLRRGVGRQRALATLSGSAIGKRSREWAIAEEDAESKQGFYLNVGDTRQCLPSDGKKILGSDE